MPEEQPAYVESHVDTNVDYFPYELKIIEEAQGDTVHRIGFVVMSDIDGTANRQHDPDGSVVAEGVRIQTVHGSADQAFGRYEEHGIPVWLISSRTLPEVRTYQGALGIHGGAVVEDGTGILLPDGMDTTQLEKSYPAYHIQNHEGKKLLVLAPENGMQLLSDFFSEVEKESQEELVSSITGGGEEKLQRLMEVAGHATRESAADSTVRFASAYIPKPSDAQRALVQEKTKDRKDVRVFDDGHVIHVMAGQSNKATALSIIYDHPYLFFPNTFIDKVFPVACGNHTNDIALMHQAIDHGGIGIMVAGPTHDHYYVDTNTLPENIMLTHAVAGEGLAESVDEVFNIISQRFPVGEST